jgi:hypothetical protein
MFSLIKRLTSWLRKLFGVFNRTSTEETTDIPINSLTVRIIGPRRCGKTTYLGAILACPNRSSIIKNITAIGQESKDFETDAINLLADGGAFARTPDPSGIAQLKEVKFAVTIKPSEHQPLVTMTIFSRDYPGQILDDFELMDESKRQMYMADCEESQGILLLLEATRHKKDFDYAIAIKRFVEELIATKADGWQGRIAFGLTKCENLQIYAERKEKKSQGLIEKYFPKTLRALNMACYNKKIEIGYFSMSAFGMRGIMLEENVIFRPDPIDPTINVACVKYPKIWKPFGLFAPLYWLSTGKRFPDQYEE